MEFGGRLAIQQRVLPDYRRGLFDLLARSCRGGLSVFAGRPLPEEGVVPPDDLGEAAWIRAKNLHLLGGSMYLCLQPGITGWLRQLNPDVLIVEANPRELSNRAAVSWMRRRGRPVLGWGLGAATPRGPLAPFLHSLRVANARGWSGAIAYGTRGKREFESLGLPPARVFVAPNAVAPRSELRTASHNLRPESGRLHLLFVGRLQDRKRVDLLLKACAGRPETVRLQIVGDGPARPRLEALAAQVFPSAEFLGDVRGPNLALLFDQSDVFVLPGTGGLAIQQALAHGLPVIAGEGDGTQEDMVTAANGWIIPEGDGAALDRAVEQAVTDRGRLKRKGAASRGMAQERFNLESMAEAFLGAVRSVSGKGS